MREHPTARRAAAAAHLSALQARRGVSRKAISTAQDAPVIVSTVIVYAVIDDALSPTFPLGDALEVFIRREDAERFIAEVRGDDPEIAAKLRMERELEAAG